ncbi:MAG: M14 family zinc carboxypeptidase, partial [Gemmatimonadales bacterium]
MAGRLALCLVLCAAPLAAQQTVPERTGGRETSRHADVLAFLDTLQQRGAAQRIGTLGTSVEGRRIPFVVAARPLVYSPAQARATGKPIIWLQGNIHSGEVEG